MDTRLRKTKKSRNEKIAKDDGKEQSETSQPKRTLTWHDDKLKKQKQKTSQYARLRQRRKSVASDMSLPAIDENKNIINNGSRQIPSVSGGREVSFNRSARRASVASTTSLLDHWSAASTESSLDSVLSRGSWANKANRRGPASSLTSFRTVGNRVATLLRAKKAFTRLKRKPAVQIEHKVEKNADTEVKELPKQPRFASTLSAEAQYAIMKGYEDVVHKYLCNTYPEYRNLLRRSRTPQGEVRVKSGEKDKEHKNGDRADDHDDVDGQGEHQNEVVTSTPLPGDSASPQSHISSNHPRSTASSLENHHLPMSHSRVRNAQRNLARYNTLPAITPSKDRQLMMTYRYQCAMDILDNIKQKMGLHPLSPRMKAVKATPVKEFNSWSYNWNNEFEVK